MNPYEQAWFYESTKGAWFNEWTSIHILWGAGLYGATRSMWSTLLWHTLYEAIEGRFFPVPARDVSMKNHLGDTLAALAGAAIARPYLRGR